MGVFNISGVTLLTGLSTDPKPDFIKDKGITFGSKFIEEDTGKRFEYGATGWFFTGSILSDDAGDPYNVQNPLPTNDGSTYCQDIDIPRSNIDGWTGDLCSPFRSVHEGLSNGSADNPKTLFYHFNRHTVFGTIVLSEAEGGNFSNVRITVLNPGQLETIIVDETSDNTKYTDQVYRLVNTVNADAIRIEFLTADPVAISDIFIPNVKTVKIDGSNFGDPIHGTDTDPSSRVALNSIFGDRTFAQRQPFVANQYVYGLRDRDGKLTELNGGTVAVVNRMLQINTGINAAGQAIGESRSTNRYVPGEEAFAFFTVVFTPGQPNSFQRVGMFDDEDGIYIGFEGTQFTVTRRSRGVDFPVPIDVTKVFPLEAFDPTKGNVYRLSFGYLGFAPLTFEVLDQNRIWRSFHIINYQNTATVTNLGNTYLPIRGEAANTGNTTDIEIKVGSNSAGVVGPISPAPATREYALAAQNLVIATPPTQIGLFRNAPTYNGLINHIKAVLTFISAATDGNKNVAWWIYTDPTIVGTPVWAPAALDSIIEVDNVAAATFGTGNLALAWNMSKVDSLFEPIRSLDINILPEQIAAIYAESPSTNTIDYSIRWDEEF